MTKKVIDKGLGLRQSEVEQEACNTVKGNSVTLDLAAAKGAIHI